MPLFLKEVYAIQSVYPTKRVQSRHIIPIRQYPLIEKSVLMNPKPPVAPVAPLLEALLSLDKPFS